MTALRRHVDFRNKRLGVDLCFDGPQMELVQEVQIAMGVRETLKKALEKTDAQIRVLRKTIRTVNQDLYDKETGMNLDQHAQELHTHRSEVNQQVQLLLEEE